MKYFAIQQQSTGFFMPATLRNRGFTDDEPTDPRVIPPRLFTTKRAAKGALTWWLKGVTSVSHYHDHLGEYDETWHTEPKPERKADDMLVVPVYLEYLNCRASIAQKNLIPN